MENLQQVPTYLRQSTRNLPTYKFMIYFGSYVDELYFALYSFYQKIALEDNIWLMDILLNFPLKVRIKN